MRAIFAACLALAASASAYAGPLGILGDKKSSEPEIKSSFQSFSFDKTAEWDRLKKVCVKPVDASQLPGSTAWQKASPELAKQMNAELPALAEYMRSAFCDELKARTGKSWELVDTPDDETAVLQLSITRLQPVDSSAAQTSKQAPSISFDAHVLDKKTGKTVMSFSETRNLNAAAGSGWSGDSKEIIKGWAASFAEISMPKQEEGKDRSRLRKVARMLGGHFALRKFMD